MRWRVEKGGVLGWNLSYACDLFKAKFLDNWEERDDKSWGATQPKITKQYAK